MSAETSIKEVKALDSHGKQRFYQLLDELEVEAVDPEEFVKRWKMVEQDSERWYTMADLDGIIAAKEKQSHDDTL